MYQNYIFDLYGTLVDIHTDETVRGLWKQMAELYTRRGAAYRPEELRETYEMLCREETKKKGNENGSPFPEPDLADVFRMLYERAPGAQVTVTEELLQHTADEFRTLSLRRLRPRSHAAEVLKALHRQGKKVYLLSNAQRLFTVPELFQTGLYGLFDAICLSSDAGIKKPDPAFLERLLKEQGAKREESVLVGNELDTDMAVAAFCGVRGIFLNTGNVPLSDIRLFEDRMRAEGIEPDFQMQMSGDLRYVLRTAREEKTEKTE